MSPVKDSVQVALRGGQFGPVVKVVPRRPLPVLHVDLVIVRAALRARHGDVGADGDVVGVVAVDDESEEEENEMMAFGKLHSGHSRFFTTKRIRLLTIPLRPLYLILA